MKTITVRLRRPRQGWTHTAGVLDAVIEAVEDDLQLYVLLRRVREKAARADRGELQTEVLPFEFSLGGAVILRDYLHSLPTPTVFLADLFNHLRDAIDDHEEVETREQLFDALRRRAELPASPVRRRWDMEEAVPGDADGTGHQAG